MRFGRLAGIVDKLLIYPDAMKKNLEQLGGLVFSQRVMLALTQAGVSREDAYRMVQRNAMKVWESNGAKLFLTLLKEDADVIKALEPAGLEKIFDYGYYTKHAAMICDRAFAA